MAARTPNAASRVVVVMVGPTLVDIREHIESLASDGGDFSILCARTGERPFPVAGKRFESRATARAAATATEQYRAALRRYDPHLPWHAPIVREETGPLGGAEPARDESVCADDRWTLTTPAISPDGDAGPAGPLVEFCHDVAAAVFETLSARGHDAVESAVMEDYLALAEDVADPDRLCLCLVESMAGALGDTLSPTTQAAVLAEAADRLAPASRTATPVAATFAWLRHLGLVGEFSRSPVAFDRDGAERTVAVELRDYALSPRGGRLPTLPVVVDLHRRTTQLPPARIQAAGAGDEWRLTVVFGERTDPAGLSSAPVETE